MATLRNKKKLAPLNKEICEGHTRRNLAQILNVPRSQEDYITQVSDEIEGRVTNKVSQEFIRTENLFLGALSRLDDFLMNPLFQGHSGTAPETSQNAYGTNPRPEASTSQSQTTRNSDPDDAYDTSYLRCANVPFSSLFIEYFQRTFNDT